MLSIKSFSSSNSVSDYYSHGDYYGGEGQGIWFGDGAEFFGLSGNFDASKDKKFRLVLEGVVNKNTPLGRVRGGNLEHCPAYDLTFSAPKSFSIEVNLYSTLAKQKQLKNLMQNSVKTTLSYATKEGLFEIRKGHGGIVKEKATKLVYALFSHSTNRKLEPQEHIHCLLANISICKEGKVRSLSTKPLIGSIKFLGQIFRNELAHNLKQAGYRLRTTLLSDGSSSFELAHITDSLVKAFSNRRKEIVDLYNKYGAAECKSREKIVIYSREAKKRIQKKEICKIWASVLDKTAKEHPVMHYQDNKISANFLVERSNSLDDLLRLCISDVSFKNTIFHHRDLLQGIIKYSIGDYSISELNSVIKKSSKEGLLIEYSNKYTTSELLYKEKEILKIAKKHLKKSYPLIEPSYFSEECRKFEYRQSILDKSFFELNDNQRYGLRNILISKDGIIIVDGLAGVGKSTILKAVREISSRKTVNLTNSIKRFQGIAPTASATKTLEESACIKSSTLHSFLQSHKSYMDRKDELQSLKDLRKTYIKSIVFVDEASLISTNQMYDLFQLKDKLGFKLILIGDQNQLGAFEAGKDFQQLINHIPHIKLNRVIRQRKEHHREAVLAASFGKINRTFIIHDKNIEEKQANLNIASVIAQKYINLNLQDRERTLLISPTRKLKERINREVRDLLYKEKKITGPILSLTVFRKKEMRLADYSFAMLYNKNDIIRFLKNYSNGIVKNNYYTVLSNNITDNSILIEKDNKRYLFNFRSGVKYHNKLEVFKQEKLKLQEGMKIQFLRNNNKENLINSETAIVEKIHDGFVSLKMKNGNLKLMNKNQLHHIDYGYCSTIHASQGKTYENSIVAVDNTKLDQRSWLVILSRHKENLTVVVQEKDNLNNQINYRNFKDMSALELYEQDNKNNQIQKSLQPQREINLI